MKSDEQDSIKCEEALARYKQDVAKYTEGSDEYEVGNMIVNTSTRLLDALRTGEWQAALLEVLTFSRQLSDTFVRHPPSMMALSDSIRNIEKRLKRVSTKIGERRLT